MVNDKIPSWKVLSPYSTANCVHFSYSTQVKVTQTTWNLHGQCENFALGTQHNLYSTCFRMGFALGLLSRCSGIYALQHCYNISDQDCSSAAPYLSNAEYIQETPTEVTYKCLDGYSFVDGSIKKTFSCECFGLLDMLKCIREYALVSPRCIFFSIHIFFLSKSLLPNRWSK